MRGVRSGLGSGLKPASVLVLVSVLGWRMRRAGSRPVLTQAAVVPAGRIQARSSSRRLPCAQRCRIASSVGERCDLEPITVEDIQVAKSVTPYLW